MHASPFLASVLASLTLAGAVQAADIQVSLGDRDRVTRLFAYPNNCSVICYRDWTLEQTVEHYLGQSLTRDGYDSAQVKVGGDANGLYANFTGVPADYGRPLTELLQAGDLAYQGASRLNGDGKWQYDWYFFLPLGMALENRRSIELLHFPPDYSLTQAQDYLESKTTDRWADLLVENGVPAARTPAFQTIVDIAPIAAPASAGSALEGVYGYFTDYQKRMVGQLTQGLDGATLPMVAFGSPVRNWLKQQYGATVKVLGLASIDPTPGGKPVAVLGANHPSYIWYAADPETYDGDQQKADAAGLKVMAQDLTAACWQAGMGQQPGNDPGQVLNGCAQKWQVTQKAQSCQLFYTRIRTLTPDQAKAKCAGNGS